MFNCNRLPLKRGLMAAAPRVVLLTWKTGGETQNLGFNVYREQNGSRIRLNASLIAGSALLMRGALPKHSGKTYTWIDGSADVGGGTYWLEDVSVNGTNTMHGPVTVEPASGAGSTDSPVPSETFSELSQTPIRATAPQSSHPVEASPGECGS